jgi:hypothetical protein
VSKVWVRRLLPVLGCAAVVLGLLAGCGGESPASKAFGGLSSADEKALPEWSQHFRDVPAANVEVVAAFSKGTETQANQAVQKLGAAVDRSTDEAKDFESAKLRAALASYMAPFEQLVDAYRAAVAYFTEHPDTPDTDPRALQLITQIQKAAAATRAADRTLISKLTAVMNADQRKKFLDQVNEEQKKYDDQADAAVGS